MDRKDADTRWDTIMKQVLIVQSTEQPFVPYLLPLSNLVELYTLYFNAQAKTQGIDTEALMLEEQ
jgi:hypothetical protein